MIHGVTANQESFHPVQFKPGLNVVLAERTDTSTKKDTRNGLGKSTLIDIIDFCLGARASRGKGLFIEPMYGWEFTLEITLAGNRVKVTRAIDNPNRFVIDGATIGWIDQPDIDKESGEHVFNLDRWKVLLGHILFGVPPSNDGNKYKPTLRSLISYFIRSGVDAYTDPFRHTRLQQSWDVQINVGFLLGLNWKNASKWQDIKDQEKGLKAINDAIKIGAMEGILGTVGEWETERIQLEEQIKQEEEALKDFKVHPMYESIQQEVDKTTAIIHNLTNKNIADRRRLARYRESTTVEKPPASVAIEKLYAEAGLIFPDMVRRTLSEAREFHSKIVENRRDFLATEIKRLDRIIEDRNDEIRKITETRATSLEILKTHGALQEMTRLQEKHMTKRGKLDQVRVLITRIKDLTSRKRDIKIAKAELTKVAEQDHEQRRNIWSVPVRIFNENSHALYNSPGHLVINISETGFKYDIEINKSGSEGIGKMKIFCFDLMLLQTLSRQHNRLNFLVHDSGLYDSVDSRQRALALERTHEITEKTNTQYICALNSDMIPHDDFSEGFDFDKYVRLILTDKNPSDSLLGFHFEKPDK